MVACDGSTRWETRSIDDGTRRNNGGRGRDGLGRISDGDVGAIGDDVAERRGIGARERGRGSIGRRDHGIGQADIHGADQRCAIYGLKSYGIFDDRRGREHIFNIEIQNAGF